jgi:hypothetical protein
MDFSLIFFNWYSGGWSQLSPLGTASTNRHIVPAPGDYDDGEFGGMIGRGNRYTRRKPAPVPLCPPQDFLLSSSCMASGGWGVECFLWQVL